MPHPVTNSNSKMTMLANPPIFPTHLPAGYECFADETTYDPDQHLALEWPEQILTLAEFGYDESAIDACASPVAVTSPFRMLSEEGVRVTHQVVSRLKAQRSEIAGDRVPSHLAGGVYRSKFLRDLCACPEILDHLSKIGGTPLAPHSMPSQQLYVNYAPQDLSQAVDAWHFDGIGFDYVLMMSDPGQLKGGAFEYFQGTKFEIAETFNLAVHEVRYGITSELPQDRVIRTRFPAAGYAIFQQGNMVVHRAAKLLAPGDRITMVPGFVSRNFSCPDPTAVHDMPCYGEPGIVAELARHSAWLAQTKLQHLLHSLPLSDDSGQLAANLKNTIADVISVIRELEKAQASAQADKP